MIIIIVNTFNKWNIVYNNILIIMIQNNLYLIRIKYFRFINII